MTNRQEALIILTILLAPLMEHDWLYHTILWLSAIRVFLCEAEAGLKWVNAKLEKANDEEADRGRQE